MFENVVEFVSTEKEMGLISIPRKQYEKLVHERDEYRDMLMDSLKIIQDSKEVQENIESQIFAIRRDL